VPKLNSKKSLLQQQRLQQLAAAAVAYRMPFLLANQQRENDKCSKERFLVFQHSVNRVH